MQKLIIVCLSLCIFTTHTMQQQWSVYTIVVGTVGIDHKLQKNIDEKKSSISSLIKKMLNKYQNQKFYKFLETIEENIPDCNIRNKILTHAQNNFRSYTFDREKIFYAKYKVKNYPHLNYQHLIRKLSETELVELAKKQGQNWDQLDVWVRTTICKYIENQWQRPCTIFTSNIYTSTTLIPASFYLVYSDINTTINSHDSYRLGSVFLFYFINTKLHLQPLIWNMARGNIPIWQRETDEVILPKLQTLFIPELHIQTFAEFKAAAYNLVYPNKRGL